MSFLRKLFLFAALFSSATLVGQTFRAGILSGISTSQVGGDGYSGFNKAGINVGAYTNTAIGKEVDLQFEIAYIQKGSRKNPDTENGDTELLILRLDYVEVPVLFKYNRKSFYLEAGLYAGVLVNFYIEDESGVRTEFFEANQSEQVKDLDAGALFGLGYNITNHFILNSRFEQTIGNVKKFESGAQRWLKSGWSNTVISFTVRYEFGSRS